MLTIVLFLLTLGTLVFIHEFGHFTTARRLGVSVEEFGFGFPPRLVGWRKGGTLYSLNAIPFGGFVKLKGESGENDDPGSFMRASLGRRALIIVSGVVMNFFLAIVLFAVVFFSGAPTPVDRALPGAKLGPASIVITAVIEGQPASRAGLKPGDALLTVDGQSVATADALRSVLEQRPSQDVTLEIRRGRRTQTFTVRPEPQASDQKGKIGVGLETVAIARYPLQWTVINAVRITTELTGKIVVAFGAFIRDLLVFQRVSPDVAGPVGIAVITGQVSQLGIIALLEFVAVLSLSLAVINVLPLPALDGGRLLFIGLERLRGRPVNRTAESLVHNVGFVLLLLFIAIVSFHDLQRFGLLARASSSLRNLFGR